MLAQQRDSIRTPREFSTPVTPPTEPPAQQTEADEDLKKLLAQERDSRRTNPVTPPIEPPATTQTDEGLKRQRTQERNSKEQRGVFQIP